MKPSLASVLAALLPVALASSCADQERHYGSDFDDLCLSTFFWCSRPDGVCDPPSNIYPSGGYGFATLWSTPYTLQWDHVDRDVPLTLRWDTGRDPDDGNATLSWSRNFTNGETRFDFSFKDLAADADRPEESRRWNTEDFRGNNLTVEAIRDLAKHNDNAFWVSQNNSGWKIARSTYFAVMDDQLGSYILEERHRAADEKHGFERKWKLGVGIGVGLGVPLFMAAAFGGGFLFGKRKGPVRKADEQDIAM